MQLKRNLLQEVIRGKLYLFGRVCGRNESRKMKLFYASTTVVKA